MNFDANFLANVASILIPSEGLMLDTFFLELLYMPSLLDNITNWRVFGDDQQIDILLRMKYNFKYSTIDEVHHDQALNN